MKHPASPPKPQGIALVLALSVIVLLTILVIGLLTVMMTERSVASAHYEGQRARILALSARERAVASLRDTITAGESGGRSWALQPGKITVIDAAGAIDPAVPGKLYSEKNSSLTDNAKIDLNMSTGLGVHPIASGSSGTAPVMEIEWHNILKDPSLPASKTNQVTSRYAYWMDDESGKLNINTADGSKKYTDESYGSGLPSEVRLASLSGMTDELVEKIVDARKERPFQEPKGFLTADASLQSVWDDHRFDITHVSRSPDLTFFGEPKINLVPAIKGAPGGQFTGWLNMMTGDAQPNVAWFHMGTQNMNGLPLTQIYPHASQLPSLAYDAPKGKPGVSGTDSRTVQPGTFPPYVAEALLSQRVGINAAYPATSYLATEPAFDSDSETYALGMRIARYLSGKNSAGNAITWPSFPGSDAASLGEKYTARQIDSITLQILDIIQKSVFSDALNRTHVPYLMPKGFLSGKPVIGSNIGPKITEVVLDVEVGPKVGTSEPTFKVNRLAVELFIPEAYGPAALPKGAFSQLIIGDGGKNVSLTGTGGNYWEQMINTPETRANLGSEWWDTLWKVENQAGHSAVDLQGRRTSDPDLEPAKAAAIGRTTGKGGGVHSTGTNSGRSVFQSMQGSAVGKIHSLPVGPEGIGAPGNPNSFEWEAGKCVVLDVRTNSAPVGMGSLTTSVTMKGGLSVWVSLRTNPTSSGDWPARWVILDAAPLDGIGGVPWYDATTPKKAGGGNLATADEMLFTRLKDSVLPFGDSQPTLKVPASGEPANRMIYHWSVQDPLVNKFPGDWRFAAAETTGGLPHYSLGEPDPEWGNPAAADPRTIWAPRTSATMAKTQRFSSVGALQNVRTGIMPDDESVPLRKQHGTPFRTLNFAASTDPTQSLGAGKSYPDWAMLDLFTVPAGLPVPAVPSASAPDREVMNLTSGGATAGRINPSNVIEPFSSLTRPASLEAVFSGLKVNETLAPDGTTSGGDTVDATALAAAVAAYVETQGRPLLMPGEIANVPAINALTRKVTYLLNGTSKTVATGNDLVRQAVGNLTTRSNVFSVWSISQTVRKHRLNTAHDRVETSGANADSIVGQSRMRFIVERYVDLGSDGVAGNASAPGPDGIVGSPDDVVDPQEMPTLAYPLTDRYKYRVIYAEDVSR